MRKGDYRHRHRKAGQCPVRPHGSRQCAEAHARLDPHDANAVTAVDPFYAGTDSLFVRAYDAFYRIEPPQIAGDIAFYAMLARESGGRVLELACGTGRVTLALAEQGSDITGVDISEGMLTMARRKAAACPDAVRHRLTLVHQDMTRLDLPARFGFAFVPFRSFQHLLTIDLQRAALASIARHLLPDGRLALHLFDPRLDLLGGAATLPPEISAADPATGHRFVGEILRTRFDHLAQIRRDVWRYRELNSARTVVADETREMALRWTYRHELRHLLELCGFAVEAEHGDFAGGPPAYGEELIVVARRNASP
jgi:ubiquinone/menaquinone biosynthesis C-methylase UbiE